MFAIAMLFIGPPIGQWRAAQQLASTVAPVALPEHAAHAHHADIPVASHSHGHSHASDDISTTSHHAGVSQVGVLVLDHCGYCHLVACFAALPGTGLLLPALDWERLPLARTIYEAPRAPFVSSRHARAPPVSHT